MPAETDHHELATPASTVDAAALPELLDLTGVVTVFVSTFYGPTFTACRQHLALQDTLFDTADITSVAPAGAAFQQMIDACVTPYYVQVDDDMLLFRSAIRTLYEAIAGAPPDVAVVVGSLYDVHLERSIEGVKIFRHDVAVRYPWSVHRSVVARNRAMAEDGWSIARLTPEAGNVPGPLGLHGTGWTPRTIYERYRGLERLRRANPHDLAWFQEYAWAFLERYRDQPTDLSFFALQGLLAGCVGELPEDAGTPDHLEMRERDVHFQQLERYWRAIVAYGKRTDADGQRST